MAAHPLKAKAVPNTDSLHLSLSVDKHVHIAFEDGYIDSVLLTLLLDWSLPSYLYLLGYKDSYMGIDLLPKVHLLA